MSIGKPLSLPEDKLCPSCNVVKKRLDFYERKALSSGLATYCKECTREKGRACYYKYQAQNIERAKVRYRADKEKHGENRTKWQLAHPEEWKAINFKAKLKYRRGISLDEYNLILSKQDGKCANKQCLSIEKLEIDHDHRCCPNNKSCKKCLRGILCSKCNRALGFVDDDISKLLGLIDYLQEN